MHGRAEPAFMTNYPQKTCSSTSTLCAPSAFMAVRPTPELVDTAHWKNLRVQKTFLQSYELELSEKSLVRGQGRIQGFIVWVSFSLKSLSCPIPQFIKKRPGQEWLFLEQLWLLLPGVGRKPDHPTAKKSCYLKEKTVIH